MAADLNAVFGNGDAQGDADADRRCRPVRQFVMNQELIKRTDFYYILHNIHFQSQMFTDIQSINSSNLWSSHN